jgi:hypothetical protein
MTLNLKDIAALLVRSPPAAGRQSKFLIVRAVASPITLNLKDIPVLFVTSRPPRYAPRLGH